MEQDRTEFGLVRKETLNSNLARGKRSCKYSECCYQFHSKPFSLLPGDFTQTGACATHPVLPRAHIYIKKHTRDTLLGNKNIPICGDATLYFSTQKKIRCLLWPLRGKVVGRLSELVLCMLSNLVKSYIDFQYGKSP